MALRDAMRAALICSCLCIYAPCVSAAATCAGFPSYAADVGKVAVAYAPPGKVFAGGLPWELLRDNKPWVPRGVVIEALSEELPASPLFPKEGAKIAPFDCAELSAIARYGADTIRFQISPTALAATQNGAYQAIVDHYYPAARSTQAERKAALATVEAYRQTVTDAVALARASGFTVILSMQNQEGNITGAASPTAPTAMTQDAWKAIASVFAADKGVMYELYNEPVYHLSGPWTKESQAAIWHLWQSGDGKTIVGHQALVDYVRNTLKARNVLIVDGVQGGAWVSVSADDPPDAQGRDINSLRDPLRSVVYAVHPYPGPGGKKSGNNATRWQWDHNFGFFAAANPVMATEWNSSSFVSCRAAAALGESPQQAESQAVAGTVNADSARIAYDFLTYAQAHHIGVFGWAFDYPKQLVADFQTYTPTTYRAFACDPVDAWNHLQNIYTGGGGQSLQDMWNGRLRPPSGS